MSEQAWKGWPYEDRRRDRDTGAGVLIGHLIFGVAGMAMGFGFGRMPKEWFSSAADAALKVLGW